MARKRKGRRGGGFRKAIRMGYRMLGLANTASWVLSGDVAGIGKHLARKKTVKWGGRIIK